MILWHVILKGKIEIKGTRTSTRHNSIYPITHYLHEKRRNEGAKWRNKIVAAVVVIARSLSYVRLFATPRTTTCQASLSFTISWSLLKLMPIESVMVMPSDQLILCHSLLLLPSIFASIRVFSTELALRIKWPKYWSFSFSISPSNEYSGLISFRIYWFDCLAFQGTRKSLLHQTCCYSC